MKHIGAGIVSLVAWLISGAFAQDDPNLIAPTEALSPAEQQKHFHLPPGFEIELIASEPQIGQPTNIAFDSSGRLWINSTLEYPYPAKEAPRDTLSVMEDTNGDGVPDSIRTFADGLNIPIGVAKVKDAVLCYSIPSIYLLRDKDGDGACDERQVAYSEFGFRDTHGMGSSFRPWIDGWVYGCHGFSNDSSIKGQDGKAVQMNSGNTYRLAPDGSHIEQMTWGQVNPYGLAFDPMGNLYSSDCHSKPAYMLLRGGYYPSFGKPHDGLGYAPELLEHLHGSTGIAGVVYYAADHFPQEFRDNLFIGNPVTGRINRDSLERHGSTYRAKELPDFISCDDRWFRPVDIRLAPDGSLYIADFYNCIIGHYEVPLEHPRRDRQRGRIWRVVYRGTDPSAKKPRVMPDLTRLGFGELVKLLGDENLEVRTFATNELADRGEKDAAELVRREMSRANPAFRTHGMWVIERLVGLNDAEIRALAGDTSPMVRTHLMKAIAERSAWSDGDLDVRNLVIEKLRDEDGFARRASAEALGLHPDRANVEPLLAAWREAPSDDTHLIHVIRIALRNNLRELGDIGGLAASLGGTEDVERRFADVCLGIKAPQAAHFLISHLDRGHFDAARMAEFCHHAARHSAEELLPKLDAVSRKIGDKDDGRARDVLRAISNASAERGRTLAPEMVAWSADLALRLLSSKDPAARQTGIEFGRDLRIAKAVDRLCELGQSQEVATPQRLSALEAVSAIDPNRSLPLLIAIVENSQSPAEIRKPAAEFLGKLRQPRGVAVLTELLKIAPTELAIYVARGLSWSDDGGDALLKCLEAGTAAPDLLNDGVVSHELRFRTIPNKDQRIGELKKTIPSASEALRQLVAERRAGYEKAAPDAARGAASFKKNCAACHQLAGQGAKIGPQLDGIGVRGMDRILEDTLDPDRNVDQAFRRSTFLMTDGRIVSGLFLRQEGEVIVVADGMGKEVRLQEGEVEERQQSHLSPMPNDVARALPPEELYDLVAFLLSQRK